MLLPNHANAVIDRGKLVEYLLNSPHPDNGGKAAFFAGWGFARSDPDALGRAIRGMIARAPVARRVASAWGEKFVVDRPLDAPDPPGGPTPAVRTVWITDLGGSSPRLVTAYPVGKG